MENKANLIPDDRGRRTEDGEKNGKQSQSCLAISFAGLARWASRLANTYGTSGRWTKNEFSIRNTQYSERIDCG